MSERLAGFPLALINGSLSPITSRQFTMDRPNGWMIEGSRGALPSDVDGESRLFERNRDNALPAYKPCLTDVECCPSARRSEI